MRDLEGRIALVTGGAKGVGKVIALDLAQRGAHVLINCFHSYGRAKDTQAEIAAAGGQADILRASVARRDQVDRMFDDIEERFGSLDILVNNAASGWLGPVGDIEPEHFVKALDANLQGSFWCARRAAPLMARRGGGTIVNISSVGAGMVPDNYLVVGTSKAAVESLTRHLAAAYAPLNIRVNTASCSLIRGEVAELFPRASEMQQVTIASTPLGRLATPEDLVGVVTFLTSDLSRWVTGQVVLADGGLSLANAMMSPPKDGAVATAVPAGDESSIAAGQTHEPATPEPAASEPVAPEPVATETAAAETAALETPVGAEDDAIVVVGMGLVVPGANTPDEYWAQAMAGAERFVDVPADRWDKEIFFDEDPATPDKTYQKRSGFVTDFVPDARLAAEIASGEADEEYTALWLRHALHQALTGVRRHDTDRVVFAVGYTADGNQHFEESLVLTEVRARLARLAEGHPHRDALLAAADRVLNRRLWRGRPGSAPFLPHRVGQAAMRGILPPDSELLMIDTACSSSLYAVDIGMKSLLLGTADVAVCGGSFALGPRGAVLFSKLHGLSTGGAVRSLDRSADGVLFSDGAGVVVLKRLSRARADGDTILGLLAGVGSSSDGKGKAIYAPSPAGQQIAVERALAAPGVVGANIDWVVAHATGTPAGDLAEFTTLRTGMPADHTIHVTSNKSLIGHTGWAAGVVSLIEVLLAMRHETIPGQYRFESAPEAFKLEGSKLQISASPVPWPRRDDRPRAASVSGFGFGGTNANVVVQEYEGHGLEAPDLSRAAEPVVLVGWSTRLPGMSDRGEIERWVRDGGPAPDVSFGDAYPKPDVRIPPGTLRTLDRCQLMILESVFTLRDDLGAFLDRVRDRTAVLAGHMGATRNGTLYALRCYLDDLRQLMSVGEPEAWQSGLDTLYEQYADEVRRLVPQSNEDSFPGIMPNVIPARVANYLDFHGPNMTIDAGLDSTIAAIAVALRYLQTDEVDLALVAGINGNSTPAAQAALAGLTSQAVPAVAEGVVTLALTRESTARENDLPILAFVDRSAMPDVTDRSGATSRWSGYLGGAGAFEVLDSVLSGQQAATIASAATDTPVAITIRAPQPEGGATPLPSPASVPLLAPVQTPHPVPAELLSASTFAGDRPTGVLRYLVSMDPAPPEPSGQPALDFLDAGCVVVTDDPRLLDGWDVPADTLVLSTTPPATPMPTVRALTEISVDTVTAALALLPGRVRGVRLLTDLTAAADPEHNLDADPRAALALNDLLFLTIQAAYTDLTNGGSIVGCLLGAVTGGALHPFAGFHAGLLKSTAIEMPGCRTFLVATTSRDPGVGAAQARAESTARHQLPVALYDGDERKTLSLQAKDAPLEPESNLRLSAESVVLATGGSRGITGELLKAIAASYQPTIYVMGSSAQDQQIELPERAEFIRRQRQADPSRSIAALNPAYDRLHNIVTAQETLGELRRLAGADRVHYLRCDVRDDDAVAAAVSTVLATHGRIDLLLNTAGINRSTSIPLKKLEDYQTVRDIKVIGYQNLKRALGDTVPGMWCNFSSLIGLTGQLGEIDYAAGNDFLATASTFAATTRGSEEFAMGWNLWRNIGLGADPVKKTYLDKSGMYTPMETGEGIHHFLREINLATHDSFVVFMGDAEKAALLDYLPQFLTPPAERLQEVHRPFFLDSELARSADSVVFERTFDLERDSYLGEHVVHGHATLPGTFVTEIAAEAALALEPGRHPVVFENASFLSFLRVYEAARPVRKKVEATVVSRDDVETVVRVRILTDVIAPNGSVLATDRPHFSITVRLRDAYPHAPQWSHWPAAEDGRPMADPYHLPNPAVQLTRGFVSTTDTRLHALGRRAEYDLHLAADDPRFRRFVVPAVLLDGLVRVSVLDPVDDGYLTLAAPASMRRIDLYEPRNDLDLAAAYPRISLYSTPADVDLEAAVGINRCVAVAPDGHVIAQIHDTTTALLGYVHPETGAFRTVQDMAERRRARQPVA